MGMCLGDDLRVWRVGMSFQIDVARLLRSLGEATLRIARLERALFDLNEAVDSEVDIGTRSSAFRKRVAAARKALEDRDGEL